MAKVYLFKFATEADAIADPEIGGKWYHPPIYQRGKMQPAYWALCIPNVNVLDSNGTPYAGFWILYTNGDDATLDADAALQVSYDPAVYGPTGVITNNIGDLSDYYVSPIYAGDTGPWANSDPNI